MIESTTRSGDVNFAAAAPSLAFATAARRLGDVATVSIVVSDYRGGLPAIKAAFGFVQLFGLTITLICDLGLRSDSNAAGSCSRDTYR